MILRARTSRTLGNRASWSAPGRIPRFLCRFGTTRTTRSTTRRTLTFIPVCFSMPVLRRRVRALMGDLVHRRMVSFGLHSQEPGNTGVYYPWAKVRPSFESRSPCNFGSLILAVTVFSTPAASALAPQRSTPSSTNSGTSSTTRYASANAVPKTRTNGSYCSSRCVRAAGSTASSSSGSRPRSAVR